MNNPSPKGVAPRGYFQSYYSDRNYAHYAQLLSMIIRHGSPGPILDLGSGAGFLVEVASRWGVPIVGLEASADGIDLTRARLPSATVVCSDLRFPLPFSEGTFATVVLNQVIEHLEGDIQARTIREANRVLQPGGMILVTSPSAYNRKERFSDPTHLQLLTPRQLRTLLSLNGFRNIMPFNSPFSFFGTSKLLRYIVRAIFLIAPLDCLSATANALAYK